MWFTIGPADGPFPGGQARSFPTAGTNWGPGEHTTTVTWDGTDDRGHRVEPGRYQLRVETVASTTNHLVTCTDGSQGVEKLSGTGSAGLGYFTVDRRTPHNIRES